ncbi:ventrally expressed dharma/bozozok antagonist [Megalops cyprinoides]|uniref:ventrally expressed dharma/bozozok antagonist n=1 Tax=Megalops cyprinoides TaxID=118141 RepID=UPI0018644E35|nr:ventrally expressed dharma/bozozok antagonist [Megalops cyprinoides]
MKGHFSIEWLSQSSQGTGSSGPKTLDDPWVTTSPYASGTPSESLPGFYSSKRQSSTQVQERPVQREPSHGHISPGSVHQEPSADSSNNLDSNSQVMESSFRCGTEEEETSGYESEGGRSLSPVGAQSALATSPAAGRRPRTAFTAEQINHLEKAFKRNAYLGTHDKAELCKKLNLSDKQIRNWFQNRRMKLKRTLHDALAQACQAKVASQLMHFPDLQAFRPAPYPSYYPVQEHPAPYLPPSSVHYTTPPAGGAIPTLPMDSLYTCSSVPGLVVPPASAPLMPPYHPYPHHY